MTEDRRRARDFTPVPEPTLPKSGQADNFIAFLEDKVVPFIDATYRTDPSERGLGGYTLGGLFSAYATLKSPETFNRCLAIDPSIDLGEETWSTPAIADDLVFIRSQDALYCFFNDAEE